MPGLGRDPVRTPMPWTPTERLLRPASRGCRSATTPSVRASRSATPARCSRCTAGCWRCAAPRTALAIGDWRRCGPTDGVLAYLRGGRFLVALNLTGDERALALDGLAGEDVLASAGGRVAGGAAARPRRRRASFASREAAAEQYCAPCASPSCPRSPSRCSSPPPPQAQNPWLGKRVLNIAHQGGEDEFPSNTLYAFKRSVKAGADMLELDVGVTKDGKVVVSHDTTLDRTTNGRGTIESHTLKQIRRLDGALLVQPAATTPTGTTASARPTSSAGSRPASASRRRATRRKDFRVPTLTQVMKAFPRTPINIEIKGRTKAEADAEYVAQRRGARRAAARQQAARPDRRLVPAAGRRPLPRARARDRRRARHRRRGRVPARTAARRATASSRSSSRSPTRSATRRSSVTNAENVARAHGDGYAWHTWLSDDGESPATWRQLIDWCVDGVMTARPVAFEKVLRGHPAPEACG